MHQSILSADISPQATPGILHLPSARVPGFVPIELPRGSDLLSIINAPSLQLMPHESTLQLQTDLPSIAGLLSQNLFQSWGKVSNFKYGT